MYIIYFLQVHHTASPPMSPLSQLHVLSLKKKFHSVRLVCQYCMSVGHQLKQGKASRVTILEGNRHSLLQ